MNKALICIILLTIIGFGNPLFGAVDELVEQYFVMHKNLASDSIHGVAAAAAQIAEISRQAAENEPRNRAQLLALADTAAKIRAVDVAAARSGFGDLSDSLIDYLNAVGAKTDPPYRFYCSMIEEHWLQPDKRIRNPYYGASMLECGELVHTEPIRAQPAGFHHHH
jgi:hypothetical protein